jgi:tetratricopeptide (TPR) repeat protein
MHSKPKLSSLFKEAELYRQQGLLYETLDQYRKIEKIIRKQASEKNKESLLNKIRADIETVEKELNSFIESKEIPEVSEKVRELMRTMFSLDDPEVKGSSLMGEAIALAGFGQYEAAAKAFERLLDFDHLRLDSAKKMLLYGIEFNGEKEALLLLRKWETDARFSKEEINYLVKHLQYLLKTEKKRKNPNLPDIEEPESNVRENDLIDVSAVRLRFPDVSGKENSVRLIVNFQHGIKLNIVVPQEQTEVAHALPAGKIVKGVVFSSPIGSYTGTIYVLLNRKIDFGPHIGDISVNLKIIDISGH